MKSAPARAARSHSERDSRPIPGRDSRPIPGTNSPEVSLPPAFNADSMSFELCLISMMAVPKNRLFYRQFECWTHALRRHSQANEIGSDPAPQTLRVVVDGGRMLVILV
ncbi:hypothetical protein BaRGS_00039902 [Batillaria attramentaria]|uniref:Uncharacterized protein n=1 Tax=Batillaria attramentaria TaxID=370345 RepID=A0ABD0J1L8_9CAEN